MLTLNFSRNSNKAFLTMKKIPRLYEDLKKVHITQLTFTCSKSTIETLEQGVKHVQI